MGDGLADQIALVSADRTAVHAVRDRRLADLLGHAARHSPWHRERLQPVADEPVSADDLTALPSMTKSDLMDHWDAIVCDRRLNLKLVNDHIDRSASDGPAYLLDEYHALATGGTTGFRGVMVWDFEAFRLLGSRLPAWGISYMEHSGAATPIPVRFANVGSVGTSHVGGAISRCFSNPAVTETISIAASAPIEEIIRRLEAIQPTILGGYASILHELAERKRSGDLNIDPIGILQSGEPLLPEAHQAISSAFGTSVRDVWGSTEIGFGASSFPGHDGLVIAEDLVIIEPVDTQGRAVAPGERAAKMLVTNLTNRVLPIIRYEISDEVTLAEPDPGCPWTGARLTSIHGRQDDVFHYATRAMHPHTFRSVFTRHTNVSEYQVQQTQDGADVVVVPIGTLDTDRLQLDLTRALEDSGLPAPSVQVTQTEHITRHSHSHKLKRFIPT
jgi:phenylacetate-coenzyme A ligase PaaK-like adenylate-forming protein